MSDTIASLEFFDRLEACDYMKKKLTEESKNMLRFIFESGIAKWAECTKKCSNADDILEDLYCYGLIEIHGKSSRQLRPCEAPVTVGRIKLTPLGLFFCKYLKEKDFFFNDALNIFFIS